MLCLGAKEIEKYNELSAESSSIWKRLLARTAPSAVKKINNISDVLQWCLDRWQGR